jgi:hypothetical protein
MIYKFFENVKSIEELKRQYKTLAFKHHPDRGGKVEDMQRINAEYDELYKRVKNIHETADGKTYEKQNTETENDVPDKFRDIINAIINFDCKIELCGSWLWVFNAYEYRQQLKALGFFYCSNKKRGRGRITPIITNSTCPLTIYGDYTARKSLRTTIKRLNRNCKFRGRNNETF